MLNDKYSKENRLTDVENLNTEFLDSEYSNQYLKQFKKRLKTNVLLFQQNIEKSTSST